MTPPLRLRPSTRASLASIAGAGALLMVLAAPSCGGAQSSSSLPSPSSAPKTNAQRSDYAGSASCQRCHQDIYEKFISSPMHRMTRDIDATTVSAPFDGSTFSHGGDDISMQLHEGRKYMRLRSARAGEHLYRITKVIGGRKREDFAGVEVQSMAKGSPEVFDRKGERIMPVSFLRFQNTWRYKGYSVMTPERDGMVPGASWRQTCIQCHNTTPFLTTIYDDLLETQDQLGPRDKYQGSISDRLLPPERRLVFEIQNEAALRRSIGEELALLQAEPTDGPLSDLLRQAIEVTRRRFDQPHLIETGIGCESCHNGAKAHAQDPIVMPSYAPRVDGITIKGSGGKELGEAESINRACARCHTVLFSQYSYTWEGGQRNQQPGGSNINSGEARDFLLGGCASQLTCTQCHDPHAPDDQAALDRMGTPSGNHLCVSCHNKYESESEVRAHAHHDPKGAGGACIACHMPRKNMSLDYNLTRYHRIGSPNDPNRVERDRPLECALCHVDMAPVDIVETMERWWKRRFDPDKIRELYPAGDEATLLQTLRFGKPHEQVAAASTMGTHGTRADARHLVRQLTQKYPLGRYYARHAIESLVDAPLPVDLHLPSEDVIRATNSWLEQNADPAP